MRRILAASLSALACVPLLGSVATATGALPSEMNLVYDRVQRFAAADVIVVGKVTAHEQKTVRARLFPTQDKEYDWHLARVKVSQVLLGSQGLSELRVGMPGPLTLKKPLKDGGKPRFGGPTLPHSYPDTLDVGKEAIIYVRKHFAEDFYILAPSGPRVVSKKAFPTFFAKDVAMVKRLAKLAGDPMKGLKAKKKEDRMLTTALLLLRYRQTRARTWNPNPKTEPVDAAQSKLIMSTLAEADWFPRPAAQQINPNELFLLLGPTEKDGFKMPPRTAKDFGPSLSYTKEYARKVTLARREWVKKNVNTYRVQRIVEEEPKGKK
jgi:hypothetical protein